MDAYPGFHSFLLYQFSNFIYVGGYAALIIILINTHHRGRNCRQLTVTLEDRSSTMQLQLDPIYKLSLEVLGTC